MKLIENTIINKQDLFAFIKYFNTTFIIKLKYVLKYFFRHEFFVNNYLPT